MIENRKFVHFLKTNPRAWIGASLPKFKATAQEVMNQTPLTKKELKGMPWSQRHDCLNAYALKRQERRWEEEAGIKAEDSHFTLIVPIHNEGISLPSFLRTLMLADIPSSVNMNVVFITNACSDCSNALISEFLTGLGEVEIKQFHSEFGSQLSNKSYKMVKQHGLTFMHVDTQVRGKANALSIGNSIARESGHVIAMSVDANNYVEPDVIRVMFTHAYSSFHGKPMANDTVLLSGMELVERKASHLHQLMNKGYEIEHLAGAHDGVVHGWMMAWNTEWVYSINGPPRVAIEDYAMGVLARVNNYKIEQVKEANVWGYKVADFKSLLEMRARFVRGRLQLLDLVHRDPSVLDIVEKEAYYMRNLPARLKYLLHKSTENPLNFPKYVATFLLWEYALRKGKHDYRQDPKNQSWRKVSL